MSHAHRLSPKEYRFLVNGDAHHSEVIIIMIAFIVDRKRVLLYTGAANEETLLLIRIIWNNVVK